MTRARSSRPLRFAACLATLTMLTTACGGDGSDADEGAEVTEPTATTEGEGSHVAGDDDIEAQRAALRAASAGAGPQSPRALDSAVGSNAVSFDVAPPSSDMNLCNIHFHEGAEHQGGGFTTFAGNGDGEGNGSGFVYDGELTAEETAPYETEVGVSEHGSLVPGDTIEIHYVHSTDAVEPGPTLNSCLADPDGPQPQLRVQAQVYVLVNDDTAGDLVSLTAVDEVEGLHQAINMPTDLGEPVEYAGSTTGPAYNEKPSMLQVTWAVSPEVLKVDIASVEAWFEDNVFDEEHAHGVRTLIVDPELLSPIG